MVTIVPRILKGYCFDLMNKKCKWSLNMRKQVAFNFWVVLT